MDFLYKTVRAAIRRAHLFDFYLYCKAAVRLFSPTAAKICFYI